MQYRFFLLTLTLVCGLSLLAGLLPGAGTPAIAQAQQQPQQGDARCFSETDQCISGPIRAYWEANGGLPVFGFPTTAQQEATVEGRTIQVQWFERDRLEIQADGTITAGRLGARLLELRGRPWQSFPMVDNAPANCRYFPETRHSLCEPFLSYWQNNGGLERFGFPITERINEQIEGRDLTVQYFERRRMELHPNVQGQILLGLLGNEVLNFSAPYPVPDIPNPAPLDLAVPQCWLDFLEGAPQPEYDIFLDAYRDTPFTYNSMGCPMWLDTDIEGATQQLERGEMLWINLPQYPRVRNNLRFIFAVITPGPFFRRYNDTWQEGDPTTPDFTPPREGLYPPWGGFGKVWAEDPVLRDEIGWALEPQSQPRTVSVLSIEGETGDGGPDEITFMVYVKDTDKVYVFGDRDVIWDVATYQR